MMRKRTERWIMVMLMAGLTWLLVTGGCNEGVRWCGYVIAPSAQKTIKAQYPGLRDHSIAVMISVDDATNMDYPRARLTLGAHILTELEQRVDDVRVMLPFKVARWQDDNLHWETMTRKEIAKKLNVDYLLFVALDEYSTRHTGHLDSYQGRVNGQAKLYAANMDDRDDDMVWETEVPIQVVWPKTPVYEARTEGRIRNQMDRIFARKLVLNFYDHKVEMFPEEDPKDTESQ